MKNNGCVGGFTERNDQLGGVMVQETTAGENRWKGTGVRKVMEGDSYWEKVMVREWPIT